MVVDPEAVYRIAQARTHLRRLEGSANLDVDALDRIVVFGEIGYAIVHRVALPVLCERLARRRGAPAGLSGTSRPGSACETLHGRRMSRWTDRYERLGGLSRPQTPLLLQFRAAPLANAPDDP